MRVIAYVEVECDDCGKCLRRLGLGAKADDKRVENRLFRLLGEMAVRHGWRMEGPSVWAGDLCSSCWSAEKTLLPIDNSNPIPIRRLAL